MKPSSVLVSAAQAYFNALSTYDADQISAVLSSNFKSTLAPIPFASSLGIPLELTGDAFAPAVALQGGLFSDWSFTIKESWPNEKTNVITVWALGKGTINEQCLEPGASAAQSREYIFILTVGKDNKIERAVEFVDTEAVKSVGFVQG